MRFISHSMASVLGRFHSGCPPDGDSAAHAPAPSPRCTESDSQGLLPPLLPYPTPHAPAPPYASPPAPLLLALLLLLLLEEEDPLAALALAFSHRTFARWKRSRRTMLLIFVSKRFVEQSQLFSDRFFLFGRFLQRALERAELHTGHSGFGNRLFLFFN